jgi:hypothetical protein
MEPLLNQVEGTVRQWIEADVDRDPTFLDECQHLRCISSSIISKLSFLVGDNSEQVDGESELSAAESDGEVEKFFHLTVLLIKIRTLGRVQNKKGND